MRNVYLAQISNMYGNSLFLPYSVGCLWAYAQTIHELQKSYELKGFLVYREPIAQVAARLDNPAILGLSCYTWNWRYSLALAKAVKDAYPECLIVIGGPQVPDSTEQASQLVADHDAVDILVHGEGEITFADVLLQGLEASPDYGKIDGIEFSEVVNLDGNRYLVRNRLRNRLTDLSVLPSPYTTGIFNELMEEPVDFVPTMETNRGCGYGCSFCQWGSATLTKTKNFPDERLLAEIDWFSDHRIRYVCCADANFGIMPRDVALAEAFALAKAQTGWPKELHATYAKNATDRVFAIAKTLNDAGMCKGVTMSFQSLDAHTLAAVKRSNIKIDRFEAQLARYHAAGIPTYTEMILPLPEETLDSFKGGLCRLLDAGQHEAITVYQCRMLPNTEMHDPAYRQQYGLLTVEVPSVAQHSVPAPDEIQELEELVVGTAAMPTSDWLQAAMFAWGIQTFHCLGLTRLIAQYLYAAHGVSYRAFYETLLDYAHRKSGRVLNRVHATAYLGLIDMLSGHPMGRVLPGCGPIAWPSDEAAYLELVCDKPVLLVELSEVVEAIGQAHGIVFEESVITDLLRYQLFIVRDPCLPAVVQVECDYDWPVYWQRVSAGAQAPLTPQPTLVELRADRGYDGDREAFAREVVFWGRKQGATRYQVTVVPEGSVCP